MLEYSVLGLVSTDILESICAEPSPLRTSSTSYIDDRLDYRPDNMERARTAPFYSIPPGHVVSVEHPAIIHNVNKAVDTLQGNPGISKVSTSTRPQED